VDPAETLETVNRLLCEDNPQSMFVTVFLCVIDLANGRMSYANGGHNPPLISLSGGPYEFMKLEKGVPPGMFENSRYQSCELDLHAGDKLYLYTDGMNEAMNGAGEQFGNLRFLEKANTFRDLSLEDFDRAIREEIVLFAKGAEQSDDITTLAVSYLGGHPNGSTQMFDIPSAFERETSFPAVLDNLDRLLEWMKAVLEDYSCPPKAGSQIVLVTEELFVNIANYAYPKKPGDITVRVARVGKGFVVQYEDGGIPFNPLEWPAPETKAPIEERSVGGLGIHLVGKMTDHRSYRRLKDKNLLTIFKYPGSAPLSGPLKA
jgi:sigma-B regulation protein RsbU (phosphoserine phosphatase)